MSNLDFTQDDVTIKEEIGFLKTLEKNEASAYLDQISQQAVMFFSRYMQQNAVTADK